MATFAVPAAIAAASLLSKLFEKKPKAKQFDVFSPEQKGLQNQLLQMLGPMLSQGGIGQNPLFQSGQSYLQNLLQGGPEAFEQFEAPFMRQFQEQTIPGLAERFSGLGAGSQSSSGFRQALGAAGSGLSENLASLRSSLQGGALGPALSYASAPFQQLQNLLSPAFQSRFSTGFRGGSAGPLAEALAPIMQGFGGAYGQQFGENFANQLFQSKAPVNPMAQANPMSKGFPF